MSLSLSKIERLKVSAYTQDARSGSSEEFIFLINPDEISSSHENQFHRVKGINTSGRSSIYSYSSSDQLSLKLIVDQTVIRSALPGPINLNEDSVSDKVENFLKYCFYMDGDIHEPRFLVVEWGAFNFDCRLKSVHVTYSHFDEAGAPLRATLDVVFIADIPHSKRIKLENKKSPDITHTRTILQGDTLTALSKDVYKEASYYLRLAQVNQLNHFRKLKPGSKLHFPPLEK